MKPQSDGKLLENKLSVALKEHCCRYPSWYYRFPDTRAARNIIAEQPGDFMFLTGTRATLIECKSTEQETPFPNLLDKRQIGKHRLWLRAGQPSVFVYGDDWLERAQIFDGESVVEAWDDGRMNDLAPVSEWDYSALATWLFHYQKG